MTYCPQRRERLQRHLADFMRGDAVLLALGRYFQQGHIVDIILLKFRGGVKGVMG